MVFGNPIRFQIGSSNHCSIFASLYCVGRRMLRQVEHGTCQTGSSWTTWPDNYPRKYATNDWCGQCCGLQCHQMLKAQQIWWPSNTLAICGWVCHDASCRNPKRSKTCIDDIGGGTGQTFHGFVQYLQKCQPKVVLWRNGFLSFRYWEHHLLSQSPAARGKVYNEKRGQTCSRPFRTQKGDHEHCFLKGWRFGWNRVAQNCFCVEETKTGSKNVGGTRKPQAWMKNSERTVEPQKKMPYRRYLLSIGSFWFLDCWFCRLGWLGFTGPTRAPPLWIPPCHGWGAVLWILQWENASAHV